MGRQSDSTGKRSEAASTVLRSLLVVAIRNQETQALTRMFGQLNKQCFFLSCCRAVTDPRDGRRVALKKLPNVFQSLVSSKRVFRELKMLCFFKHENVSYLFFCIYNVHALIHVDMKFWILSLRSKQRQPLNVFL